MCRTHLQVQNALCQTILVYLANMPRISTERSAVYKTSRRDELTLTSTLRKCDYYQQPMQGECRDGYYLGAQAYKFSQSLRSTKRMNEGKAKPIAHLSPQTVGISRATRPSLRSIPIHRLLIHISIHQRRKTPILFHQSRRRAHKAIRHLGHATKECILK
jgi:hypothetical protein